jgi:hypothetical protein
MSTLTDPDDSSTDAIYINFLGYIFGDLTNWITPYHNLGWDAGAAKLKLYSPTSAQVYTDFVAAIKRCRI